MELSYSLHLSNDKNKSIKARQEAKNTPSGTTSKNNNAIQNVKQLGKVNHHNLRLYDNKQELIKNIKGSNDITKDVKELYLDLFEDARLEYNNKQTRDDRKIDNYFNKIANDTKHDLACEIVIELGNMEYWDEKSLEYKYQMTQVFEKLPEFIQKIVEKLFNNNVLSLFSFKHDYDPEERKANQEFVRKHNLFNKREMKIPQNERLIRLNNIARKQMELLKNNKSFNNLEYIENRVNNKQTLPL